MTPDEALLSIIAGIISSLLAVLVIELARVLRLRTDQRALRRVLALRREHCFISAAAVESPRSWVLMGQREAHAFAYVGSLALRIGVEPEIIASQDPAGSRDAIDEFCVGGPLTNQRTSEVLRNHVPDFEILLTENARTTKDPQKPWVEGFRVAEWTQKVEPDRGFAFLGKIESDFGATIHLVFGINDLGVAAAAYYLHSHYRSLAKQFGDAEYLVVLSYSKAFGYKSVRLERDCSNFIHHTKK